MLLGRRISYRCLAAFLLNCNPEKCRNQYLRSRLLVTGFWYESHHSKCIIPTKTKTFYRTQQQLITKECYSFSIKLVLFQFGCHGNQENFLIVLSICLTDCAKSFITSVSQQRRYGRLFLSSL